MLLISPHAADTRLLWEFINDLLADKKYNDDIRWEDESQFIFRIVNPRAVAKLWGCKKNKDSMTYEKLSRALRYYYRLNIIVKVPGQKLTYRYL